MKQQELIVYGLIGFGVLVLFSMLSGDSGASDDSTSAFGGAVSAVQNGISNAAGALGYTAGLTSGNTAGQTINGLINGATNSLLYSSTSPIEKANTALTAQENDPNSFLSQANDILDIPFKAFNSLFGIPDGWEDGK